MVSQSRIWGAREEALSGLEGQLEVVGLELMAESIMASTHSKSRKERVPDFSSTELNWIELSVLHGMYANFIDGNFSRSVQSTEYIPVSYITHTWSLISDDK